MKIHIEDFRNIASLDLEIPDNKVSLLTGVSGTGKTAIADAIGPTTRDLDLRAGSDRSVPVVEVNPCPLSFSIFDETVQKGYCYDESSSGLYKVMLRKGESHRNAEEAYERAVEKLKPYTEAVEQEIGVLRRLQKDAFARFKDGRLHGSCSFSRAKRALGSAPMERRVLVRERGGDYLEWLTNGVRYPEWIDEGICPFCHEEPKSDRAELIRIVTKDADKTLEKVSSISKAFADAGIPIGDLFAPEGMDEAADKLESAEENIQSYCRLLDFIRGTRGDLRNYELPDQVIDPHCAAYSAFDGLPEAINDALTARDGLRRSFGVLNREFKKTLDGNSKKINDYLEALDVPYRFELLEVDGEEEKMGYRLRHVNGRAGTDYKAMLSFGEKNMVSLVLFLLEERDPDDVILIDDPVSSYDEFRREVIYRMLFELSLPNTVIIFSHDHVFAKYALHHYSKALEKHEHGSSMSNLELTYLRKTGSVLFLENVNGIIRCGRLEKNDYGTMLFHIEKRLRDDSLSNCQKILNLRAYYEIVGRDNEQLRVLYGYTSALLHLLRPGSFEEAIAKVEKDLDERGVNETDVLSTIKRDVGVELPCLARLAEADVAYELADLLPFERVMAMRETASDENIRREMSDIVHMNSALVYCLSPYKYISCSKRLSVYLEHQD